MATGNMLDLGLAGSTGTGAFVGSDSPTLVTPALGTPASGTLTNCTGLPISTGVSGLGTNVAAFLATPSSANLAAAVTDETGSGALVFANTPTLVTPVLGTPTSGTLTNCTGLPLTTGVTGILPAANGGTGVNNGSSTVTLGGAFEMSGAYTFTGTLTANTAVTFPTSGTLATTASIPTGAALTRTNDTNVTVTLGGNDSTALVNAASLTMGWTGTLGISRGGTGLGTTPTAGQLLIGNNTDYTLATLTAGANIAIDNSTPGAITISTSGGSGYVWSIVTGTSQAMAVDNAYITNNVAQVDCSLPASSSVGDTLLVKGYGAGGWKISQGSGQSIRLGNQVTTTGASGYLESANQYDSVELVCVVANTEWIDIGREGNITYA